MRAGCEVILAGLLLLASTPSIAEVARAPALAPAKIEIRSRPIAAFDPREPERRRFGSLSFRGGLELSSTHKQFGGLSAIRLASDGRFLALTDRAYWVAGRILYRGEAPTGIAQAEIAPLLYSDGRPITERGWYDSEAMAEDAAGSTYVAIERVHRILKFDTGKRGLLARGTLLPVPPEMSRLPSNKGVECLVVAPKGSPIAGALIAISERGLDAARNIRGFLIGGPKHGLFSIKAGEDYDVVDCALTPDAAHLLILERHFSWRRGVAMRIRRVPLSRIVPGAVADGTILISADMAYQIDNMEALGVHRASDGATVLTLVSDDNFSLIQRTILLQFTLEEE